MGIARSTCYDRPERAADDTAIVEAIFAVCDEFECYGYRRVGAALRQQGLVVNAKKIRRLMREHGLQPKVRRRFVATTDSDHDSPIFPNLAKDVAPTGPNQLWVSDITYVALPSRFVYVAIILDAWSRLIVGYAIGRSIDARLTVAALKAAIARREPPPGCIHHSDRGSQGRLKWSSQHGWRSPATGPAPVLRRGQGIRSDGISSCFLAASFGSAAIIFPSRPALCAGHRAERRSRTAGRLSVRPGSSASRPLLDGREHGGRMVCAGIEGPSLERRWREVAE